MLQVAVDESQIQLWSQLIEDVLFLVVSNEVPQLEQNFTLFEFLLPQFVHSIISPLMEDIIESILLLHDTNERAVITIRKQSTIFFILSSENLKYDVIEIPDST